MTTLIKTIENTCSAITHVAPEKRAVLMESVIQLSKKLAEHISALDDVPHHYQTFTMPSINDQITAAEKRTERAAEKILTAAENIMKSVQKIPGDACKEIQNQTNIIFEATSFQDLVTQHLNEIRLRMNELNDDMDALKSCIENICGSSGDTENLSIRTRRNERPDAHLLNGPTTNI